jgi:tRNA-dihydrouridine synthase
VVTKGKGSGFLANPDALDRFFEEVFEANLEVGISVKTRIGMENPKEFEKILEVYKKYPFLELIIHPRLQVDFYKNHPNMEAFEQAVDVIQAQICYNGDIYTKEDIEKFQEKYPTVNHLMLGRGLLRTPSLLKEVSGEERDYGKWYDFLTELCDTYEKEFSGQKNVLYKMKEHWYYLFQSLPEDEKAVKAMKKTKDLEDYRILVKSILKG